MKLKNTRFYTVLGMIVVVFVAMAVAQDAESVKSCSDCKTVSSCSGCGSDTDAQCGTSVTNLPVYLDGPSVLLAQAEELELTGEQITALKAVLAEARLKAVALLTDVQVVALGEVPIEPVVLGKKTSKSCISACSSLAQCADKKGCGKKTEKCGWEKGNCVGCEQKAQTTSCRGCNAAVSCSSATACVETKGCCRKDKAHCKSCEGCVGKCQDQKPPKSCCGSCEKS